MTIFSKLDRIHYRARQNRWLRNFAVFNRIALAAGFLPSGYVKIAGERFTVLAVNHPMGHYLEALFYTGYYYPFIGVMQMTAAILLLIPRTATFGAVIYFPIILNICILSLAVRFDGSLVTSPLMVLANLYLLCWDYHKWKLILPLSHATHTDLPKKEQLTNRFPVKFFAGVAATVFVVGFTVIKIHDLMPRNTLSECKAQCTDSSNSNACLDFCDCIHLVGQPLNKCLDQYHQTPGDKKAE